PTAWSPVYGTWAPAIRRSGGRGSAVSTVAASSCWRAIASSTERSQRWVRAIRVLLLDGRRPPRGLLLTERALGGEHLLLGAPRPPPLLPPDARPLACGRLRHPALPRLELLEEEPAREEAVEGLGALALAADDEAGRPVPKPRSAASRSASIGSCGKPAISSAHSRAVGTARSSGTTAFTRPKPRASRAPTARPRRIISRARPSPTTRGSRCVPPSTSGTP